MKAWLFVLLVPAAALAADVQPGNWELTVATQLPGADKPMTATQSRCLTEEDAKDPSRVVTGRTGCEFTNKNDDGSLFTFNVACGGQVPMRGSGKVRYGPTSLEGDLDLVAEGVVIGGQPLSLRSHVVGRRLGACQ